MRIKMAQEQQITVIIPNYNGKELLKHCIETLEHQTCRDFKILVVDNGSTDGSIGLCDDYLCSQTLQLDFEIIALPDNTGFCGAVNAGIRHTTTPYFILLNNDTEVEPHFVEALLEGIQKSDRLFSCGAQMLDFQNREIIDNAGDWYTLFGWAIARGKGKPASDFKEEMDVFSCCGGAAIYRTDVVQEIGLFDENHFAYLEDVDMGYRAKSHGYRNRYIPGAKVYHVGSAATGARYNEKKVFWAARNSIFLIYKNMPLLQLLVNLPFLLLGILIKWLFFIKKRLGGQYLRGIKEGIRGCRKCPKVPFRMEHLANYFRIELELIRNIFRIILD